ncbi:hypothetical protein FGO68_gene15726 [Halteria grandinella]|uniref:Uncharacterized protein n=1 Tax=Halteria grandinella TaxID=5974 RepID=A0A8J8P8W5_HALGN|nr:hypothetical protein FGO68_gene15726 [Halteria grandinella]
MVSRIIVFFLLPTLLLSIPQDDPRIPYKYSCSDLGDVNIKYYDLDMCLCKIQIFTYILECASTYPGCRRCEYAEVGFEKFTKFSRAQRSIDVPSVTKECISTQWNK